MAFDRAVQTPNFYDRIDRINNGYRNDLERRGMVGYYFGNNSLNKKIGTGKFAQAARANSNK